MGRAARHKTGSRQAQAEEIAGATPDAQALASELLRTSRELDEARRELAGLRERVAHEAAEREELLQMVSHELRTPLTLISGYNRLLLSGRSGGLSEPQQRFLRESETSCQRLGAFLDNLLGACGGGAPTAPRPALQRVGPTIEGVVAWLKPVLEEHATRVELHLDPAAGHAHFEPSHIEQVLTNLLSNALRHAKSEQGIRVETRALEVAGRCFVEVSVVDGGPGVARAERERIFEPHVRAARGGSGGGLGLGLAICKRIVEAQGGSISVGDAPGGGSRFSFRLPAAAGSEQD